MNIVLASTSPRRRELIKQITEDFTAASADVDELSIEKRLEEQGACSNEFELAEKTVRALSREKALAVFRQLGEPEDTLVIGADTVVALEHEILGKPKDRADAVRMLRAQSMEPQQVFTGVSFVMKKEKESQSCCGAAGIEAAKKALGASEPKEVVVRTFCDKSSVFFHPLDDAQEARIQAYCDTPEPYDKAGAYGIQLGGAAFVERYEGDINSIIGFPVARIKEELESFI